MYLIIWEISQKNTCVESLFNRVAGFQGLPACNFIKKRLHHKNFPMKSVKFLRTRFFTEHLRWLFWYYFEIIKDYQLHLHFLFQRIAVAKSLRKKNKYINISHQRYGNPKKCKRLVISLWLIWKQNSEFLQFIDSIFGGWWWLAANG